AVRRHRRCTPPSPGCRSPPARCARARLDLEPVRSQVQMALHAAGDRARAEESHRTSHAPDRGNPGADRGAEQPGMSGELQQFVRDALAGGQSRDAIRTRLTAAGWQPDEIAAALDAWD